MYFLNRAENDEVSRTTNPIYRLIFFNKERLLLDTIRKITMKYERFITGYLESVYGDGLVKVQLARPMGKTLCRRFTLVTC